jgi:serine protease Do
MNGLKSRWIIISIVVILVVAGSTTIGILYSQLSDKLDDAQTTIYSLERQIGSLSNTLNSQLSSLSEQLGGLEGEVDSLNEEIEVLKAQASAIVDSVASVLPSVVYIYVEGETGSPGEFFASTGSGVILSPNGYILTNKHVVDGAVYAEVVLQDRRIFEADDIYLDDILDLAVVKINGENLPSAQIGDPSTLDIGDIVIALGHPLGMSPEEGGATITSGIVSNLGRSFWIEDTPYYDVIQTDAAISPGNSGGPLINSSGQVIGINSAGIDIGQNLNFAISIATAGHVYEDLVTFGEAHHPYLGVFLQDNLEFIPGDLFTAQITGARITGVDFGSPASLSGLRLNDIIIALNNDEVSSTADLIKLLWRQHGDESIALTIQRSSGEVTINILLEERPDNSEYI